MESDALRIFLPPCGRELLHISSGLVIHSAAALSADASGDPDEEGGQSLALFFHALLDATPPVEDIGLGSHPGERAVERGQGLCAFAGTPEPLVWGGRDGLRQDYLGAAVASS